jgi:hypothetical protein
LAARNILAGLKENQGKTAEELQAQIHETYIGFIENEAEKIAQERLTYPAILAAHIHIVNATVCPGSEKINTNDVMFNVVSVAKREFSYVALGHIHKHQDLNPGAAERGEPPVVYSGSIERITFSEEKDPKGFVIVEIDAQKRATYRHIHTPARRMLTIEIDVREIKEHSEVMEKIRQALAWHDVQDAIVRMIISCRKEQQRYVDFKKIRDMMHSAFNLLPIQFQVPEERNEREAYRRAVAQAKTMREALSLYIDAQPNLAAKKEKLLAKFDELTQHE